MIPSCIPGESEDNCTALGKPNFINSASEDYILLTENANSKTINTYESGGEGGERIATVLTNFLTPL